MPASTEPRRAARATTAAAAALLVLVAIALAGVSFASYATVKHRLDAFASDHDANLSRARFDTIVLQIRIASALLLAAGSAIHLRRQRLAGLLEGLLRSAVADGARALASLRRGVALESRLHLAALGAIVLAALLVRLDFLFQPMRYDESGTYIHYASEPLYVGLSTYTAPNNHLLHTFLVHISTALLGNHPWAIRLPAFVAGILLVPAGYLAARLLYDRSAALLAAALVAVASTLIEYSTNARGYTLVALVFLLLLALAPHLAESSSPGAWAAFALLGALGFYAVPTMLYAFGAVVVWLVWTIALERRHRLLLRTRLVPTLLAAAALTLILYSPVIATSGFHALAGNSFVVPQTWSYFAHHLPSSVGATFRRWHRDEPAPVWALLAAGFVIAVACHGRLSRFRVPPAAAALVFVAPVLVAQHVVPFERVWLFLLPLYLMTAAAGLLFAVGRLRLSRHWTPAVAAFLERTLRPGDRVVVSPPADLILEYYLDAAGLDAGRLLYTGFRAKRLFAVVKEGPREYPLPEVIRQHLTPPEARGLRPLVIRRFPHAVIYRLLRRAIALRTRA